MQRRAKWGRLKSLYKTFKDIITVELSLSDKVLVWIAKLIRMILCDIEIYSIKEIQKNVLKRRLGGWLVGAPTGIEPM